MNSLEFAISMELDGEKYYKEQAEMNNDNRLKFVFLFLAKDEANHARILQNKFKEISYELQDNSTLYESKSVFKEMNDFKSEIWEFPKQLDLYKKALEDEKQSIDLYVKLLAEATNSQDKELFEYLVKQETEHYAILEELILLISRPDEWVESADFGVRKKY